MRWFRFPFLDTQRTKFQRWEKNVGNGELILEIGETKIEGVETNEAGSEESTDENKLDSNDDKKKSAQIELI